MCCPCPFFEYLGTFGKLPGFERAFDSYLTYGAFPEAVNLFMDTTELARPYL
jgi:predicted AAA+ superfamily ATPase